MAYTPSLRDDFGIGQEAVRRIYADLAMQEMGETAPVAFSRGYQNDLVRDMMRRRFYAAREVYEACHAY